MEQHVCVEKRAYQRFMFENPIEAQEIIVAIGFRIYCLYPMIPTVNTG